MGAFCWYEATPTVIATDSEVVYINCPAELLPDDDATREWAAVAAEEGVPVRVPVQRDELTGECVALTVAEFAAVELARAEAIEPELKEEVADATV